MIKLKTILTEVEEERNREMISGTAELLRGVEDLANRRNLAHEMMGKFEEEGVQFNPTEFLSMCGLSGEGDPNINPYRAKPGVPAITASTGISEADSPTERTRRYNRKNKKKVRAYLRKTQDDRVARNSDRAKAVKKHGKSKMKNHDVHHPNGAQNGGARLAKKDHGPDCKGGNKNCGSKYK